MQLKALINNLFQKFNKSSTSVASVLSSVGIRIEIRICILLLYSTHTYIYTHLLVYRCKHSCEYYYCVVHICICVLTC